MDNLVHICWRAACVTWNERTALLGSLPVDQLYSSVSQLGGLKFFTPEFGWAHADRGTCWSSSWQFDEVVFGNLKAQNKTTMTSTNMFQGLETGSKPSSRWKIQPCSFVVWERNGLQYLILIVVFGRSASQLYVGYIIAVRSFSFFILPLNFTLTSTAAMLWLSWAKYMLGRSPWASFVWVILR